MGGIHADLMNLLKQMENPYLHHIDLHLGRMQQIMDALGRPDESLPPVIHVAGTNGKGSLIAYLRAMHEAAGRAVHVYTSPHLVRFNERIIVAGEEVADQDFYVALQKVHRLREQFPTTLFEGVTAAAFLIFAKKQADVLLLEVGLGGRLDATNVVAAPLTTVITPVSLDHMEFLGESIRLIAKEKAGIIKAGVPCVVGPQEGEAMVVISQRAQELGAPLFRHGHEWKIRVDDGHRFYVSDGLTMLIPTPALVGDHQWENAGTAIAVMDVTSRQQAGKVDIKQAVGGISSASWPARLQRLQSPRWLNLLPEDSELWLDGGHNPAAGKVLATWIGEKWGEDTKVHIICGMVKSKDINGFLNQIAPRAACVWAVPIHDKPRAITAGELLIKIKEVAACGKAAHSVAEALAEIGKENRPAKVLITGSLYLAGTVLAEGS